MRTFPLRFSADFEDLAVVVHRPGMGFRLVKTFNLLVALMQALDNLLLPLSILSSLRLNEIADFIIMALGLASYLPVVGDFLVGESVLCSDILH